METMETKVDRIVLDPNICHGKPTVRGTRVMVETVLGHLGAGDGEDEILYQYPSLKPEDIKACLEFASKVISRELVLEKPV